MKNKFINQETLPKKIPDVTFKTCSWQGDIKICGGQVNWKDVTTDEIFKDKKIVLFALPGAFTPTCSSAHLPSYEEKYDEFKKIGIDEVLCLSVNDPFVMFHWGKDQNIKKVKLLPDGSGEFTKEMEMLVKKDNLGFGDRSWRYSMYVDNREIKKMFIEPELSDNCQDDPFEVSDAGTMLNYLKNFY